jgi:hypothetical protein
MRDYYVGSMTHHGAPAITLVADLRLAHSGQRPHAIDAHQQAGPVDVVHADRRLPLLTMASDFPAG